MPIPKYTINAFSPYVVRYLGGGADAIKAAIVFAKISNTIFKKDSSGFARILFFEEWIASTYGYFQKPDGARDRGSEANAFYAFDLLAKRGLIAYRESERRPDMRIVWLTDAGHQLLQDAEVEWRISIQNKSDEAV